ncbi:unnamed protein product [Darwinula stevensoni]|uniref:Enoyl-[acyl-carrier-protein] reductase, mitochondrial n=1 Tax=Darwinula stevensoni TaxID=69355 RepID=A0A7R9A313_9CRUS|nr:unnamed protein product [Darwinula stevensoni]CAG0890842.1 unnamed protein product [Darwinula stevensoni]
MEVMRLFSSNKTSACQLIFYKYGDPTKVVEKETLILPAKPQPHEVIVEMLASPVNPGDINTIQGVYGVKPSLPSTPGNEGVGKVSQVGSAVMNLKVGDWVLPKNNGWGTWRSHVVSSSDDLIRIANDIPVASAATMAANPCTAYRLLHDFVNVKPGDSIIQNGANSSVGQAVIQVARYFGLKTINIVRDRPDIKSLKDQLYELGADHVVTEEELKSFDVEKNGLKLPLLGFDCVAGKSGANMLRKMDHNPTLITYGGMSKQPLVVPVSALIFQNANFHGFWMSRWNRANDDSKERRDTMECLVDMVRKGSLVPPVHEIVHIDMYKDAIKKTMSSGNTTCPKQILVFNNSIK